jgi:multiple antibiotic resistance protein
MKDILYALPNTFIPLFVAMDVFAVVGIFVSLTEEMSHPERKEIVRDSVLTALFVGLGFMALGEAAFRILGITVDDFKIAGGLILLVIAILDIVNPQSRTKLPGGKLGIVPLGVPLIVGPAVLTTLLVLVDHYGTVPTIICFLLNLLVVWVSLANAERLVRTFGKGGIIAISKLMLLLLAAIAVMMIRIGLENILMITNSVPG